MSFVCILQENVKQQTLIKTNTNKRHAVNVTGSCKAPLKTSSNIVSCFLKLQRHTHGELGGWIGLNHEF